MLPAKVIFASPLKDPAEEIDGEQDQDDDNENSDDGQLSSLVGCAFACWESAGGGRLKRRLELRLLAGGWCEDSLVGTLAIGIGRPFG
jgi:hypothetical protein